MADTQPQIQPALLRLSAMISRDLTPVRVAMQGILFSLNIAWASIAGWN